MIIFASTPRSSNRSLPLRFSNQTFDAFLISHPCYMPCPCHPPGFDHPNIWGSVEVMKLFIMQFSPSFCHFLPLTSALFSNIPNLCSSLSVREIKFHTHTKLMSLNTAQNTLRSCLACRKEYIQNLWFIFVSFNLLCHNTRRTTFLSNSTLILQLV